jgi:carbon-monoxide dehydrogenase medium subunit
MQYEAPESISAAVSLLAKAKGSARILAGGTDLLVQLRSGTIEPDLVVDIKRIPGLYDITHANDRFVIGAAVPCAHLKEHAKLRKAWPGLVEAANLIGSTQVQGRCTLTGNLCNGSPAADSVPAMIAAGAKARIQGPKGKREVPVEQIIVGPGKTSLAKGEIVTAIVMPKKQPKSGDAYLRFIPRTEMDIAVVGAGVSLTLGDKGVVKAARVSLGAVAPTPLLVAAAAEALIGNKVDDKSLDALAAAASAACKPIDDKRGTIEFRVKVAGVLARRAALIAYERAGGK